MGRKIKKEFVIFVEGASEELYFLTLNQQEFVRKSSYKLVVQNCQGLDNSLAVALEGKKYKKLLNASSKIAFVFDKDHLSQEQFNKLLGNPNIIAFSNPKFELWLLAHFEKLRVNYTDVLIDLKKYIPDYSKKSNQIADCAKVSHKAVENTVNFRELSYVKICTSVAEIIEEIEKE